MIHHKTCPYCAAHLDPGEVCDCTESRYNRLTLENKVKCCMMIDKLLKEQEAPASAANTDGGEGGKQSLSDTDSASYDTRN